MLNINCTWTAKNAPFFTHYGCVPGLYPEEEFLVTASIRSATPTNFIAGPLAKMCGSLQTFGFPQLNAPQVF
jgi:hypothetical protein